MVQVYSVYLKNLYHAYSCVEKREHFQYDTMVLCDSCEQLFIIPGGAFYYCPHCGRKIEVLRRMQIDTEYAPYKLAVKLKIFAHLVKMEALTRVFRFKGRRCETQIVKEIFTFNTRKRRSTYYKLTKNAQSTKMEILRCEIDAKNYRSIAEKSCLSYLNYASLKASDAGLRDLLRDFRDCIAKRLQMRENKAVSSLYINSNGGKYGKLLLSLLNAAHRIKDFSAENLSDYALNNQKQAFKVFALPVWMDEKGEKGETINRMVLDGRDYISAFCETLSLPNKPFVRKAIGKDVSLVPIIKIACQTFKNYDFIRKACEIMQEVMAAGDSFEGKFPRSFRKIQDLQPYCSESKLLNLLKNWKAYNVDDCSLLLKSLTDKNKEKFKKCRLKGREIHDWLSYAVKRQKHVNQIFPIQANVAKMDKLVGRYQIYLARQSLDLLHAGHVLKNCVAGYVKSVLQQEKLIALVKDTDDNKLIACIEIANGFVRQAKIYDNQPVYQNPVVNQSIVEWAKEFHLGIQTSDIAA